MRIKRALAIGATLVALTAAAGCGSDDDAEKADGKSSATGTPGGSEGGADSGLPKAADLASIAYYVNKYTPCLDLQTGDEYDADHDGDKAAWGADEAADPSWGVKERGVCSDESGDPIALLSVADMKKFQTAAKADNERLVVGEDFAVVAVGSRAAQGLQKSGLKFLTCDPAFSAPSGFEKRPGLVDGCVLSDYFPS
ncbi:hypothetical protein OG802_19080 [Streptomyces sp. NBC_00704]|uniref:hypothetical protein n=1 Tax=Streptomyces sp. NBC_00704 TaxID=2975809 RepID=UPI002E37BB0D|nr:hypothetical protein [Streptomyces sp. NBC_00704]